MQKIAHSTVALSHHLKIRDNCYCQEQFSSLTGTDGSWKTRNHFEAVNLYKKKKKTLNLVKILLVLIKKAQRYWMNFKIHRVLKAKKVNKLWRKLFDQYQDKFKKQACVREREAYNNKSNVLMQCSSKNRLGI